jgi:hypothetical protein
LAALLDLAVLFPGRAPTRFKVARKAGDLRQLQALTDPANKLDQRNGLAEAAEQILALVGSLRAHDWHTRGHSERVRVYTDLIAAEMRLTPAAVDRLRWAALLQGVSDGLCKRFGLVLKGRCLNVYTDGCERRAAAVGS